MKNKPYSDRHSGTIFSNDNEWLNDPRFQVPRPRGQVCIGPMGRVFIILSIMAIICGAVAGMGWLQ